MTTPVKRAPAKKTTATKPPSSPVGNGNTQLHRSGKGAFANWADQVRDMNITTADELYQFCDDTRTFFQEASSLIEVLATQLDHDLKLTMKKKESKWDFLGVNFGGRFRKPVRELHKIADSCEAAAKHAFACWVAYEKDSLEMQEEIRAAEIAAKHGNKGTGGFDHGF
jgi:hypothetical protein